MCGGHACDGEEETCEEFVAGLLVRVGFVMR